MNRPLDPEKLLAHSGWIRHLARSLVADDSTADDVLQDTMVAALEHPPRIGDPGTSLRAWLSTVARHFAVRRGRNDLRRDNRERSAAQPVEVPSVDRVLELEGARRRLVEHVLALDDLYRETILLRYFDELPSIEIARRLGVSDSTVRNRLRRGLALLHERLEREPGENWRQWCLLLAPTGIGGTHAPLSSLPGWSVGVLAMGTKLALLLIAAAAAFATIFSWDVLHRDAAAPNRSPAMAVRRDAPDVPVDRASDPVTARDGAGAEATHRIAENPAGPADPLGVLCFGAVRTKEGHAIVSGVVWIEDRIGRNRDCRLDARGWYSFAGVEPGHWTLRASCDGFRPYEQEVDLPTAPSTERRDLVLEAATLLKIRIRVADGEKPSPDEVARHLPFGSRLTVVATRNVPPPRLAETTSRSHHRYGIGTYQGREGFARLDDRIPAGYDGVLEVVEPLPCCVSLVLRHLVIETKNVPAGATEVEFVVDSATSKRLAARARVRVVDAKTGAPLHPAQVELNTSDTGGGGVQTDEDGVAVFQDLLPGLLELRLRAKDHAWFLRAVELEPGQETDLGTLRVSSSCHVSGKVVDENGAPVSIRVGWIDAEAADRPDRFRIEESTRSDSQGRFEFESVPRGKLLLWSMPVDPSETRACVAVDSSAGDLADVVLRIERGHVVGLRFDMDEFEPGAWIVRRSDGVAITSENWIDRGPTPLRLADGAYRIEVWRHGIAVGTQDFRVSNDGELIHVKF